MSTSAQFPPLLFEWNTLMLISIFLKVSFTKCSYYICFCTRYVTIMDESESKGELGSKFICFFNSARSLTLVSIGLYRLRHLESFLTYRQPLCWWWEFLFMFLSLQTACSNERSSHLNFITKFGVRKLVLNTFGTQVFGYLCVSWLVFLIFYLGNKTLSKTCCHTSGCTEHSVTIMW